MGEITKLSRKIVLFGPESSGKTTLGNELAAHFEGVCIEEYLRVFCEKKAGTPVIGDMPFIFKGQYDSEIQIQEESISWIFYDTNPLQLLVYHQFYFGTLPADRDAFFHPENYQLYLLCSPDLKWENDPMRDMPERRMELFGLFKAELQKRHLPFRIIEGQGNARLQTAIQSVEDFFAQKL